MALRGVWQLQKLIVSYCDWGGSSRGIRAFMETHLPSLKESNPRLEVVTELIRGQHPHLKAFYRNKNERVVCVKNMTPEDVLLHATRLRNALGRKVVKLKTRHVTKHPSVQGTWTTALKLWSSENFSLVWNAAGDCLLDSKLMKVMVHFYALVNLVLNVVLIFSGWHC